MTSRADAASTPGDGAGGAQPGASVWLNVRVPRALLRRLRVHCAERQTPRSTFVIAAVREALGRTRHR